MSSSMRFIISGKSEIFNFAWFAETISSPVGSFTLIYPALIPAVSFGVVTIPIFLRVTSSPAVSLARADIVSQYLLINGFTANGKARNIM